MKQIIKNELIQYQALSIENNTSVLDFLVKDCSFNFVLQKVESALFKRMLNNPNELLYLEYQSFIAGYNPNCRDDSYRSSGGLKLSDENEKVLGSFSIFPDKVIYNPFSVFFHKERDCFVYFGTHYYTTMSMIEILREVLDDKDLLVCLGNDYKHLNYVPILEKISREEMVAYATDPLKGEKLLQKRRYY